MRGVCQFSAPGQDALVSVVAAAGGDVVVAATAPGAMLTPWRDEVQVVGAVHLNNFYALNIFPLLQIHCCRPSFTGFCQAKSMDTPSPMFFSVL